MGNRQRTAVKQRWVPQRGGEQEQEQVDKWAGYAVDAVDLRLFWILAVTKQRQRRQELQQEEDRAQKQKQDEERAQKQGLGLGRLKKTPSPGTAVRHLTHIMPHKGQQQEGSDNNTDGSTSRGGHASRSRSRLHGRRKKRSLTPLLDDWYEWMCRRTEVRRMLPSLIEAAKEKEREEEQQEERRQRFGFLGNAASMLKQQQQKLAHTHGHVGTTTISSMGTGGRSTTNTAVGGAGAVVGASAVGADAGMALPAAPVEVQDTANLRQTLAHKAQSIIDATRRARKQSRLNSTGSRHDSAGSRHDSAGSRHPSAGSRTASAGLHGDSIQIGAMGADAGVTPRPHTHSAASLSQAAREDRLGSLSEEPEEQLAQMQAAGGGDGPPLPPDDDEYDTGSDDERTPPHKIRQAGPIAAALGPAMGGSVSSGSSSGGTRSSSSSALTFDRSDSVGDVL